jgi:Protein of unknown function (DUF499)
VFTDFYAKNRAEFPSGVAEPSYEERIKSAYPLHPELFDRLYRDWSTLDRFQRTRGVLRLMSAVIHELWERDDPAPLILPGGVPLDADDVLTEISQYLEDSFKPVIDADIDGASSTPAMIDASRPALGQRKITRRLARAIFLGSAPTLKAAHRGIERQHIWLGIATPGDTIGNFANALSLLSDQATYLYSEGARYWYSTAASVQKMAREHADRLKDRPEETWAEIVRRLAPERSTRGMFTQVQIGPERSDDIPDEAAVRLVIVHPQFRHTRGDLDSPAAHFASMAAQGRGTAHRLNRNMLVFLAADAKRYEELDDAVRQYLAWMELAGTEDRIRELELPPQQAAQARKRLAEAKTTVDLRISATYQWLLVPVQTTSSPLRIDELKADTNRDRLSERASERLRNADMLRVVQGSQNIRLNLEQHLSSVWSSGHIAVGKLWEYYCQFPYLPRLAQRSVLENGILAVFNQAIWDQDGFAVASGYDERSGQYIGLRIPTRTCRRSSATRRCSSGPTAPSRNENVNEPSRKPPAPQLPPPRRAPVPSTRRPAARAPTLAPARVPQEACPFPAADRCRGRSHRVAAPRPLVPVPPPRRPPGTRASSARSALTRNATAAISTGCTRRSSSTSPLPRAWTWRSPSRSPRPRRTDSPTTRPASSRRTPAP